MTQTRFRSARLISPTLSESWYLPVPDLKRRNVNDTRLVSALQIAQQEVRDLCDRKGWTQLTFGEEIALLHSELSEALEAWRSHGIADTTRNIACADDQCTLADHTTPGKPEGVASELADVLIRLLDTCGRHDINLGEEYLRKMTYNETRPYQHGGKRI